MSKNLKNKKLLLLIFSLLTAICIIFGVLCLTNTTVPWIANLKGLWIPLGILICCALFGIAIWFIILEKDTWVKALLSAFILLAFALILIFILLLTGFFEVIDSAESLQEYLQKAGSWMPVLYVILQFLQVVILPIPSVVSTVAGVALFGPWKTMLLSLLGIIPASVVAFFVGRKLGDKAVCWIVGEETLKAWQEKLKGKDNLFLTAMFLLPMFPDDVLCFVAGLSTMSTKYFLTIISISRLLIVFATCFSFQIIPINTWWGLLLWGLIILVVGVVFFLIYKHKDTVQDIIESWKEKHNKIK